MKMEKYIDDFIVLNANNQAIIKKASEDLERLMETTPLFPKEIICVLAIKLQSDQFRNVRTPSVLTDFHPSAEYISSWHTEDAINAIL